MSKWRIMGHKGDNWQRLFSRRYTAALLLVAALWSVTSLLQYKMISAERDRAHVIALAGQQSALSQRIAFLAGRLDPRSEVCVEAALCADLLATTERMEANHERLTGEVEDDRLTPYLGPIGTIYDAGTTPFREQVQEFLNASCQLARDDLPAGEERASFIQTIKNSGTSSMMQTHQLLVEVLEGEARRAIQFAGAATAASWVAALALLAFLSAKIFHPMAKRLGATINEMEDAQAKAEGAAQAAARANRARGEFLKTASHELKTPLNAIIGLADVIREGKNDPGQLLTEMSHASDHLLSMLNTILDSHRLDEGELEIAALPVSLATEIRAIADIGREISVRKNLRFSTSIGIEEDAVAKTDGPRIRQICLTLLDNAARFTPEGEIHFDVSVGRHGDEDVLNICVKDTGVGIEASRQAGIFDRYSSAGSINDPSRGGIGLGLSFAKSIVEMMGGRIMLESAVGEGTKVFVEIPLAWAEDAATEDQGSVAGEARVLIVDDTRPNRMVADAMVSILGGETVFAETGKEALQLAREEAFDLILMDIAMPEMDGIEAARRLRESPGPNRQTPIVAFTAHVAQEEVSDLLSIGFDAVLHKPLRKHQIARVLQQYTDLEIDRGEMQASTAMQEVSS